MPGRAFAYRITLSEVGLTRDPDFLRASPAVRAEVLRWLVVLGLKEKDHDLAAGLDAGGAALTPVSEATRKHRVSAMGPADPNAPALMPAYAVSRTRLLLEGEPTKKGDAAEFFWGFDAHTGGSWGEILGHHRDGIGARKVKRDVIGLSAAGRARVRQELLSRWQAFKLNAYRTPERAAVPGPELPPPRIGVRGRTDFEHFTYGIGSGTTGAAESRTALAAGRSTGFFQRRPGQGLTAFGGPGSGPLLPPRPPVAPTPKPRPKPAPKPKPLPPPAPLPKPAPVPPPVVVAPPPPPPKPKPAPLPPPPAAAPWTPVLPGRPIGERIAADAHGDELVKSIAAMGEGLDGLAVAAKAAGRKSADAYQAHERFRFEAGSTPKGKKKERLDALEAEMHAAGAESARLQAEVRRQTQEAHDKAHALLAVDDPIRLAQADGAVERFGNTFDPLDAGNTATVDEAIRWVAAITRAGEVPHRNPRFGQFPQGSRQRAYCETGDNYIAVKPSEGAATVVHEFGHYLEEQIRTGGEKLWKQSKEFLNHRVGDETPRTMREVSGPGSAYGDDELGRKDHFGDAIGDAMAYYVGKEYPAATEILAMGIQELYNNPASFAKKDPEWFKYVIGVLGGRLR